MAYTTSPRKVVPLRGGDDPQTSRTIASGPSLTKRAFFCGVVVEESQNGRYYSQDVQDLVASLGDRLVFDSGKEKSSLDFPDQGRLDKAAPMQTRRRAMTNSTALADVINELISTERSYVKRLQILKHDYADPLRSFARSKDTAILPAYDAKTMFGNIDTLVPVNEAFLLDLERMMAPNGARLVGGVGDVVLRHFKELRAFDCYKQYYIKREEAQSILEREMTKKSSTGFAAYIDRIKYSSSDSKSRVGLRELLMDPVQRIPRYTLMFRTMMKHMHQDDSQYAKLVEADEIASRIALAETDEQTKRAAVMYCLAATVDGFPPNLIKHSRRFIDCIDVEDVLLDTLPHPNSSQASLSSTSGVLHCSLFLFDDKLMIVKRPGNGEKGSRALSGLDELEKLTKAGGLPSGMKKSGMVCKGVIEITNVVATDVGSADMQLYLESPPQDQGDRWSSRPFRSLSVVHPPWAVNLDPVQTQADKTRFLDNLWKAQASYRARGGQSVILQSEDREVESRGGRVTLARAYFNVYQRTAFLKEVEKTKVLVHIDAQDSADPIPFGVSSPPYVIIRVQPMAGELSRYMVTSSDSNDEGEEDIVQTGRVPTRIIQTIHQYGLFKFRTGNSSRPSTPTASTRSRAAIFGLDAISRNLFNALPGSTKGDVFGGSVNSHKRSKSSVSRSSMYTETTSTGADSLMKFSHRSNSTATAATTISLRDDDPASFPIVHKSLSRSRKLVKRSKSPAGSGSERESGSSRRGGSQSKSRSPSCERDSPYSDGEGTEELTVQDCHVMDGSEWDLTMRLELARRNSKNQTSSEVTQHVMDKLVEDTIYEEDPPLPLRPSSRTSTSRDTRSVRSTTPTRFDPVLPRTPDSTRTSRRPSSQYSTERRPFGPRSPSPKLSRSPEIPSMDLESTLETTLVNLSRDPSASKHAERVISPLPRSKRRPFESTGNTPNAKHGVDTSTIKLSSTVEPLSIKKKTSVRTTTNVSPTPTRRIHSRGSPLSKASVKVSSPRRIFPQSASDESTSLSSGETNSFDRVLRLSETTKEDVESSRRAIKRIKLEVIQLKATSCPKDQDARPQSPDKGLAQMSSPVVRHGTLTKAAQERMEEMRNLIGMRQGEGTPGSRPHSVQDVVRAQSPDDRKLDVFVDTVDGLVATADHHLDRISSNQETLQANVKLLAVDLHQKSAELEKARLELQNAKRQCELVKNLLADSTAEKEIMYEAFNEELDGMYNDANLPKNEAWNALTNDLRQTKETRNMLKMETA